MAHFLVTGGAGFIGSHLTDSLIASGQQVRVLDDLSTGKRTNVSPEAELRVGSITDPVQVSEAAGGVDGVFHLAAIASVQRCQTEWAASHEVNLTGTLRIFEQASRQHIPVVYASSAAVYGEAETQPIREDAPTQPLGPYGLDKLGCDHHAAAMRQIVGLRAVGIRPFNVYGPRQDPSSPYSGVISIFADRIHRGQDVTIYGDGKQTRDFIYVADIVTLFIAAMEKLRAKEPVPELVNGCTGQAVTINQLAETLMHVADKEVAIHHATARVGDIYASHGDPEQLMHLLSGKSRPYSLETGLKQLWQAEYIA